MNLQHNSEELRQNYTSPVSEEREAAETVVPVCPERIRRIMRRVRPQSPIKKSIERVQEGQPFDEKQFQRDVSRLQNPSATKWRWRMAASWILGNARLSEEQSLQAVTALGETVEKSHKRDRLRVWGRFVGGSFTCLFFLPITTQQGDFNYFVYIFEPNTGV
ncbi:MAG: hypothetical protein NT023_21485 [Armatimonadetes bacterium]|nr:hypothetical protein [Armatimonadota bacterium]